MKVLSAGQVIEIVEHLSSEIDLVSFDVFDTLVRRRIMPPERSKIPAARKLSQILADKGIQVSIREALAQRSEIERKLGRTSLKAGMDWECPIDEVCLAWLQNYMDKEEAALDSELIVLAEVEGEKSVVYAERGMVEAVRKAQELGKRVVCISDMYLRRDHIILLLEQCGYAGLFRNCYVSSEYKLRKRTGRLFQLMLENEGIAANRWVHFGDHSGDDYARPRKLGGRSYHFMTETQKNVTKRFRRLKHLAKVNSEWAAASFFEMCRNNGSSHPVDDLRYQIGFWLIGPVLTNFIHRVIDRVNQEDIELVIFPAREAFVLQEIFQQLKPHALHNQNVADKYCFLNRMTVFPASVDHIGIREIVKAFTFTKRPSVRTMLTRFGVDPEAFAGLARECGLESLDYRLLNPVEDFKFLHFIRHPETRQLLAKNQQEHYSILEQYLGELGFWQARRVALVDVGWRGTVQDSLTCAFEGRKNWPTLFGLYLGFIGNYPYVETARSRYEGVLYHLGKHPAGYCAFNRFVQLFELPTRAPHATAVGLRKDKNTGEVLPVFKKEEEPGRLKELQDRGLVTSIQIGIFDFVDAYAKAMPFMEESAEFYTPFLIGLINRFLRLPRAREGNVFNSFSNVEDFGRDEVIQLSKSVFKLRSIGEWRKTFNMNVLWKEGYIASLGWPSLLTLYNFYLLYRYRDF